MTGLGHHFSFARWSAAGEALHTLVGLRVSWDTWAVTEASADLLQGAWASVFSWVLRRLVLPAFENCCWPLEQLWGP